MKVLSLDLHFLLPDDFDGDFDDALMEIIKYRKSLPNSSKLPPLSDLPDSSWGSFLIAIKQGYKIHGGGFLGEWKDGKWISKREEKEK